MKVARVEQFTLRIEDSGDLVIPARIVKLLLTKANRDAGERKEDLADFGPGRLVVLDTCGTDSGTSIMVNRDRRTEA